MSYLWNHHPDLSAAPKEILEHHFFEKDIQVFECGMFLLENDKYAIVRFSTDDKFDVNVGFSETEEFDSIKDAVILYNSLTEEIK